MIEQEIIEGTSGSGQRDRTSTWRPARRSTLAVVAAGAMLLAACGTASAIGHGGATPAPIEVANSVITGSTGRDAKVLNPSLVGAGSATSTVSPEVGNGGYDVWVYDWDLALSDDLTSLSGVATITAVTTQDLERFSLDSREQQVESVTVDDVPVDFYVTGPKLVITTSEALPIGSKFVVEVVYSAEPEATEPGKLKSWDVVPDEQVRVVGLPDSAATWTPGNEGLEGSPARCIIRLDVPEGFTATASGVPFAEDGTGKMVWDTGMPVFGFTFAVAETDMNVID